MKLSSATYKLRMNVVFSVMRVITPKLHENVRRFYTPYAVNDLPRPMIKYIASLHLKDLIGAEVGVSAGANAENIFELLNIKRLYLIDPYTPYFETDSVSMVHTTLKDFAVNRLKDNPAIWHFEPSIVASKKINDLLDFAYIDACHQYMSVKEDILAWFPLVKKGGVMGGHDFTLMYSGVVKAVTEFASTNNLQLNYSYPDWWIVKL